MNIYPNTNRDYTKINDELLEIANKISERNKNNISFNSDKGFTRTPTEFLDNIVEEIHNYNWGR